MSLIYTTDIKVCWGAQILSREFYGHPNNVQGSVLKNCLTVVFSNEQGKYTWNELHFGFKMKCIRAKSLFYHFTYLYVIGTRTRQKYHLLNELTI